MPLSLRPLCCCVTCCWCTAPARCTPSQPSMRWHCRPPTPCAPRWQPTSSTTSSRTTPRTTPLTVDRPQSNRTAAAGPTPLGPSVSLGNKYYVLFKYNFIKTFPNGPIYSISVLKVIVVLYFSSRWLYAEFREVFYFSSYLFTEIQDSISTNSVESAFSFGSI